MKVAVTRDGKALNAMISGIKRRIATLQNDLHIIAVSCVLHAVEHNNALPATHLIEAVTGGSKNYALRVNALKKWFEEIGCFRWNNGEVPGFKMNADRRKVLIELGNKAEGYVSKRPFWEYTPEPEYKGFDLQAKIKTLIGQAIKASVEHGDDDKTKVDPDMVAALQLLLSRASETDDNGSIPFLESNTIDGTATDITLN